MTDNTAVQRAGFGVLLVTAAVLAKLNFPTSAGEDGGTGAYVITLAICALVALALFGWAIPRAVAAGPEAAARRAAGVSIAALITVPVFWLGLPFVLGAAGATLGALSRERGAGRPATIALVLGVVAAVGGLAAAVIDQLS